MASKVYAGIVYCFLIENHHGDMVQGALADCFVTEIIMTVVEYLYGTRVHYTDSTSVGSKLATCLQQNLGVQWLYTCVINNVLKVLVCLPIMYY